MASAKTSQAEPVSTQMSGAATESRAVTDNSPLGAQVEPVSSSELNAWRRGFTPQAEIWNGRLAMLGLSLGLAVLLISRLTLH